MTLKPPFLFLIVYLTCHTVHAQKVWTLEDVVQYTLSHNPSLSLIPAKEKSYQLQSKAVRSQFYPKGYVSAHADMEDSDDGLFANTSKRAGLTPSLHWRLPTGTILEGQVTQLVDQQQGLVKQSQWKLSVEQPLAKGLRYNRLPIEEINNTSKLAHISQQQTKDQIVYAAIIQYAHLVNAWHQYEVQKAHLTKHQALADIVSQKIDMGLLSEVDGMMMAIQSARYQQMLAQSKRQIGQLQAQLLQTMGLEENGVLAIDKQSLSLPSVDESQLFEQARAYHTQSYQLELALAKKQERKIRDEYLWDVRLKAYITRGKQQYQTTPFDYDLEEHAHANRSQYVGLYVSIPFNQNAQINANLYQNKLNQQILLTDKQTTETRVLMQVRQSLEQVTYWQDNLTIANKSSQLSQKAHDIIEQKYLAGYASGLDLQQAQLQVLQSAMDVHAAKMHLFLAQVEARYQAGLIHDNGGFHA